MKLVEQGSFFQHPYFYADSIADMVGSRDEVLDIINPKLAPHLLHIVNFQLDNINHEPDLNSKHKNRLVIFDNSGALDVELPSRLMQLLIRMRGGDLAPDFDLYKNALWRSRSVILQNTYCYHQDDEYELVGVSNLVRPKRAAHPVYHPVPNAAKVSA